MKKHFLRTVILFIYTLSAFGGTYYFIVSKEYANPILVILFFLGCVGIYLLARIGRGHHTIPSGDVKETEHHEQKKSLIQQHSEMGSLYSKTATTRDKLRMLKGIDE